MAIAFAKTSEQRLGAFSGTRSKLRTNLKHGKTKSPTMAGAHTHLDDLRRDFPHVPIEDITLFHGTFAGHARERLTNYLFWREKHNVDGIFASSATGSQQSAWKNSISAVNNASQKSSGGTSCTASSVRGKEKCFELIPIDTPQVLHSMSPDGTKLQDKEGNQMIYALPALLDTKNSCENVLLSLFALFIEQHLDRSREDKITLVIDVRPGKGWPNDHALRMMKFIRHLASELYYFFPGRLHHCFVLPVPRPAVFIWNMIHSLLHASIRDMVSLLPGSAKLTSKLPQDHLRKSFGEGVTEQMEAIRVDSFII